MPHIYTDKQAKRAIKSPEGQDAMRLLVKSLDWLPKKRLCALVQYYGEDFCAMGAMVAYAKRNMEAQPIIFEQSPALFQEIMYQNDKYVFRGPLPTPKPTPEEPHERWLRMRAWALKNIHD